MSTYKVPSPQPYATRRLPAELIAFFIPNFATKRVAILDLDQEARDAMTRPEVSLNDPNAFADADFCGRFVNELHRRLGVDASLGGYLEDRDFLWQGTYLGGTERTIHLGVDINVPAGSPVVTPIDGQVVRCDDDTPERFGWGPRVFIERSELSPQGAPERWVYIFAHLAEIGIAIGDSLHSGDQIGVVGAPPNNGNWFPHLHVQKVRGAVFDHYLAEGIAALDGYGLRSDLERLRSDFPEPFSFITS